jgi:hypothetical protein
MVNVEDAIKVAGLEGKMTAIDLVELVDRQIERKPDVKVDLAKEVEAIGQRQEVRL